MMEDKYIENKVTKHSIKENKLLAAEREREREKGRKEASKQARKEGREEGGQGGRQALLF